MTYPCNVIPCVYQMEDDMIPKEIFDHNEMEEARFWELVSWTNWPDEGMISPGFVTYRLSNLPRVRSSVG